MKMGLQQLEPLHRTQDVVSSNLKISDQEFAGKEVVILGLARQGKALARFFARAGANVTVSDLAKPEALAEEQAALEGLSIRYVLGNHPLSLLDGCDLLCLSGGVPPQLPIVQEAMRRGIPLSNDSLLTFQLAHSLELGPMLAVTGSSGKTTTTTLVGHMLEAAGYSPHVGGNIGTPMLDRLQEMYRHEPIVLELSSFQLELFNDTVAYGPVDARGPHVAALLNITPNHLDRHPSMADYTAAKLNLIRAMPNGANLVLSADDPVTARLLPDSLLPKELDKEVKQEVNKQHESTKSGDPKAADPKGGDAKKGEDAKTIDAKNGAQHNAENLGKENKSGIGLALPDEWQLDALLAETRALIKQKELHLIPFSRMYRLARGAWLEGDRLLLDGEEVVRRDAVVLPGDHNISNLLAAMAIVSAITHTAAAGKESAISAMRSVAESFSGVAHRLEIVASQNEVIWINDSIATSPERARAGLRAVADSERTIILLAGGKDKNLPWDEFAAEIVEHVDFLIGFGQAGPMIVSLVQDRARYRQQKAPNCAVVQRLDEAVALVGRMVRAKTTVILSPGGTSYDMYRDFEARGEHFRKLAQQQIAAMDQMPIPPRI